MLEKDENTEYIRVLKRALVDNGIGARFPLVRTQGRLLWVEMANVLGGFEKEDSRFYDLDIQVEATTLIFFGSGTTTANTLTAKNPCLPLPKPPSVPLELVRLLVAVFILGIWR
ncbi:hypothetical protein Vi05172_g6339 [Venturia inaequalis]|nr:hypothetical protein Vi05172_g6339 [Venturia inaequalis]